MNYYNPYVTVACRHNTDVRCILSGRAAKAAMFYISDYITKNELKTYEVLSLLSNAVLNAQQTNASSPTDQARNLLHKCLSQFARHQQIHAQQAVRYLRGKGDAIYSHSTIPMLSGPWVAYWKRQIGLDKEDNEISQTEESEDYMLKIRVSSDGKLRNKSDQQLSLPTI